MHRPLVWLLLFVAVLFVGDRLAGHFLATIADQSQFRYARLYSGRAGADVLLLGNSRGLAFYQPYIEEKTGLTTCNLSYNGLPADLAEVLLLDYADRYPQLRTAIVDITLCDRTNDELVTSFLAYSHHSPRLSALLQHKVPRMAGGAQVSHLFRYNNEVFQRALYYRNRSDADWLLDRVIQPKLAAAVAENHYAMDSSGLQLVPNLVNAVNTLRAKGVKVHLVIGPYFPGFAANVAGLDQLKRLFTAQTGLAVHDYRDVLTDPNDFGDFMHPNKQGSYRYIDLMRQDGLLER